MNENEVKWTLVFVKENLRKLASVNWNAKKFQDSSRPETTFANKINWYTYAAELANKLAQTVLALMLYINILLLISLWSIFFLSIVP